MSTLRSPRPTIKMVAQAAGVSPSTVSRAFTSPGVLLETTVAHVMETASRLGYMPDHSAQALRTGNRGTIGLVVPDIANAFFPPLIRAVQAAVSQLGQATVIGDTDEDPVQEALLVRRLARQVDGVILASSRMPESVIQTLSSEVPIVLVNRDVDGLPCVLIDSGAGVRQAFDHLVELGHESIVYLSGPAASWSDSQRRRALQAAAQAHGVRLTVLSHRRPEPDGGRQAVPELLEAGATAVIAFDDLLAQGLLTGLAEQGLRVPQDMSVIGCDDTIARFTTPPLTSVQSQTAEAGTRAVAMLTNKPPSAGAGPAERLYVGSSLIVRGTTGHRRHPHPVARMHSAL